MLTGRRVNSTEMKLRLEEVIGNTAAIITDRFSPAITT